MPCTKVCYESRADAKRSASKVKSTKLRPYACPICKQYHLTSMTSKQLRQVRKRTREHKQLPPEKVESDRMRVEEEKQRLWRERFEAMGN